jgi:hypothetical protein
METSKKIVSSTPITEPDAPIDSRLKGPPIPVSTVLVRYADGNGRVETRLAVIVPGGEVYLFVDTAGNLSLRPAQRWLKESILKSMSKKDGPATIDITESTSQV